MGSFLHIPDFWDYRNVVECDDLATTCKEAKARIASTAGRRLSFGVLELVLRDVTDSFVLKQWRF